MSLAEIIYRLNIKFVVSLEKAGFNKCNPILPKRSTMKNVISVDDNNQYQCIESSAYIVHADKITDGRLDVFSLNNYVIGKPPLWNKDPKTGIVAPLEFGKTLDYRNNIICGDIKYLWEPNRHIQLVTLAQAFRFTKNKKYLNSISSQLSSWFEQCPYNKGPNWTSSLELGIRLINWSLVWELIDGKESSLFDGKEGEKLLNDWLTSIYQHCHFIKNHFSRFSSANNHLIGEAAGLFVGTTIWPYWDEFKKWHKIAYKELCVEASKQNYDDGVNKEQAISYQQFVLDFLLFSGLAGKRNGMDFPDNYWLIIEKMLDYLSSVMDVSGNVPMIGDADDGYVTKLSQDDDFCPYKSLLATGAILFKKSGFKVKAQKLDDKTRWLFGEKAEQVFTDLDIDGVSLPILREFPEGGYYILGADFETEKEIRLIVDAGPLGYTNIAAHGHADALAFTLSIGGKEFLIDPGTYSYHTQKKWRDYFRGTSAHNTVRIDKIDQSVSGGNFMWLEKAVAGCEKWLPGVERDDFTGSHIGYMRLSDPVLHRRGIRLDKKERKIIVTDSIICKENHIVEQFWHFSEQSFVELSGTEIIAKNADKIMKLRITSENVQIRSFQSDEKLPSGWVSRNFDVKFPTTTIIVTTEVSEKAALITEIDC